EGCRRRRRGGDGANIEPPRRSAPPLLIQGGETRFAYRAAVRVARCRGIAPAASILRIDSLVNSALGASPPITNIRIEGLFFGPLVTFMKRGEAPGANENRGSGYSRPSSRLPRSFSQLARQVPVMAMKVSLVSWVCSIGPLPASGRQRPRWKPSEILIAARRAATSPTGDCLPFFSTLGGWKPMTL